MSKSKLKSVLMSMDKSEIIKMVLELYSARKEAKEYLDFYAEPNEARSWKSISTSYGKSSIRAETESQRHASQCAARHCPTSRNWSLRKIQSQNWWCSIWRMPVSSLMTMETCGSNSMIPLRVISTRHCATSCFMTFGTSMIPESSNAFVGQALVDGDFLTHWMICMRKWRRKMRNSERNTGISRCPSTLIIKRIYSNGETKEKT